MANTATLPKRSKKYSVGKTIGYNTWVHRAYEDVLPKSALQAAKKHLPRDFDYTIVRYTRTTNAVSFIQSVDFDTATEPLVGVAIKVTSTGKVTRTNPSKNPLIYHHKWLMVGEDYSGFNVRESQERSIRWRFLIYSPLVCKGLDRSISSRIGRRDYWFDVVVPKLIQDDLVRSAKTAMTRKSISRPTRFLLEQNCIKGSVLHHGCGKAKEDSKALCKQAVSSNAPYAEYDPGHSPYDRSILNEKYTTVISNYVMNTLPKEARQCVWRDLVRCTGGNAYVTIRQDKITGKPFKDGLLTSKKTFQVLIPEQDFVAEAKEFFNKVEVFHRNSSLLTLRVSG